MKVASYILFVLAGVACTIVLISFFASDVRARLSAWKHGGVVQQQQVTVPVVGGTELSPATPTPEASLTPVVAQLESRLSEVQAAQQALEDRIGALESRLGVVENRASTPVTTVATGVMGPVALPVPVAPLLALKLPSVSFVASGERELFGLSLFSSLRFTAYRDRQFEGRWYFFDEDYAMIKRNLGVASAFQIKETNTFFGKSSFVNVSPADGFVRVIFEVSGKAAAFEVVKDRYESLKKLLLK